MGSNLLRQALTNSQKRFADLHQKGRLRAVLVETSYFMVSGLDRVGVPGSREAWVWLWSRIYREPVIRMDAAGKPVVAAKPFVDAAGNRYLDDKGQPIDVADCGANRLVQLEGDDATWKRFRGLATDAGHLLEDAPSSIQSRFPPETLGLAEAPLRWICALFDLAWARIPGSPLRPEIDKSVQVEIDPDVVNPATLVGDIPAEISHQPRGGGGLAHPDWLKSEPWRMNIPLTGWPHFVSAHPTPNTVRGVSDPPGWFSTLEDVVQASVHAIDILLEDIPPEDEKQRRKTSRSKSLGASQRANETRIVLIGALMAHHRFGGTNQNLDAATQQELMQLTGWRQSKLSRAIKKLFGSRGMAAYKGICAQKGIQGFLQKDKDGTAKVEAMDDVYPEEEE